jgi:NarL family two-component system sensor histidine kinase YdfH
MLRARATLEEARQAIEGLRAEICTPRKLLDRIQEDIAHFTSATGIPVELDVAVAPENLAGCSAAVAAHVQCVVAEGLANIARHARARHVWVSLRADDGLLLIRVRDDGMGFDMQAVEAQHGHYGLIGLRERARLAGGSLEIATHPATGTSIQMRLPITLGQESDEHVRV